MNKFTFWGVAVLIGLVIGAGIWFAIKVSKSEEFVYSENGKLYWLELKSRTGNVKGIFHQQELIDEIGNVPFIEEKEFSITGETTEKGFKFSVDDGGEIKKFSARFSEKNLVVQEQGESDVKLFQSVTDQSLEQHKKELQQELQIAIYHSEEKLNNFLRTFFSELRSVYGYLYSTENGKYQLFLKIDEALLEGELSGSLLMMVDTGNEKIPYEEDTYELNGITDGHMLKLYTTVDGKKIKLEGNFHEDVSSFDLSFWATNQKLTYHAVTKEEFEKSYDDFKKKVQNR
ncbi:hypothetical protein [Lederbergia citri]|uniref:Uncharacterized protein n=1 Tax=Lederbergia citri TaxID=2833580 RepID=A0A942YJF7_9BACI|nr:hypothetical protein [Lederbergia citri]MBS4196326.1 hypothetical protein [Lederbergia citri]